MVSYSPSSFLSSYSTSSSLSMNTTKRKKTRSMLSKLMKKISTPTSLSSAYILKTSSYTSSPNLK